MTKGCELLLSERRAVHSRTLDQKTKGQRTLLRQPAAPQQKSTMHPVLQWQQQRGNQYVARALALRMKGESQHCLASDEERAYQNAQVGTPERTETVQAKLVMGQPGDKYEQEAERVADLLVRMPESQPAGAPAGDEKVPVQAKSPVGQVTPLLHRQSETEEAAEDEEPLQVQAAAGNQLAVPLPIEAQIDALRGSGQPLPASIRAYFEPRLGYELSQVRVHTGGSAAETAQALHAQAYTIGRDIVFGSGKYQPEAMTGKALLAHELTHVVQQTGPSDRRLSSPLDDVQLLPDSAQKGTEEPLPNWSSPVAGQPVIIDHWGTPRTRGKGKKGTHKGVDIRAGEGAAVYAIGDGTVSYTYDWTLGSGEPKDWSGNFIQITHANGVRSEYMHLSEILVTRGKPVKGGHQIGKAGSTGGNRAFDRNKLPMKPHLHFQIKKGSSYIEPYEFIRGYTPTKERTSGDTVSLQPSKGMEVVPPSKERATWLNQAVQRNALLGLRLGWTERVDEIVARFQDLGLLPPKQTPNVFSFAQAVRQYQSQRPPLKDDGILGPGTWRQLRLEMDRIRGGANRPVPPGPDKGKAGHQIDLKDLKGMERTMAQIHNDYGGFLEEKSKELGIEIADAAAFLWVESRGQGFSRQTGRMTIRFENHVFYDQWGAQHSKLYEQYFAFNKKPKPRKGGHVFRAEPSAQFAKVHGGQSREWEVFEFARKLDEEAACRSISMGVAQVMGFNHRMLGYQTAKEMFEEMSSGLETQAEGLFNFAARFKQGAVAKALRAKNYTLAARHYNGAGQERLYGSELKAAAEAYGQVVPRNQPAIQ